MVGLMALFCKQLCFQDQLTTVCFVNALRVVSKRNPWCLNQLLMSAVSVWLLPLLDRASKPVFCSPRVSGCFLFFVKTLHFEFFIELRQPSRLTKMRRQKVGWSDYRYTHFVHHDLDSFCIPKNSYSQRCRSSPVISHPSQLEACGWCCTACAQHVTGRRKAHIVVVVVVDVVVVDVVVVLESPHMINNDHAHCILQPWK